MNAITEQINLSTDLDMSNYWMPFTANRQFKAAPRLLKSAKGMYYTTVDNRQIIDGCAGLWCVNAGHGRTEIIEAVHKQMTEMDFAPSFQMAHPILFTNRIRQRFLIVFCRCTSRLKSIAHFVNQLHQNTARA